MNKFIEKDSLFSHSKNTYIATINTKIIKQGFYIFNDKKILLDNTNLLINSEIINEINYLQKKEKQNNYKVSENILKKGTIQTIIDLRKENPNSKIIALNFASATSPGGGYINGSKAQEECLCRCSTLYYTIKEQKDFYLYHRQNYTPMYSDKMIYSKNVQIFRNEKLELLEKPIFCDFITSPAVNRTKALKIKISDEEILKTMNLRIEKMINLMVQHNPDYIILGAWGCGVFGNDRKIIYKLFEEKINFYVPKEMKVIFSVL